MKTKEEIIEGMRILTNEAASQNLTLVMVIKFQDGTFTHGICGTEVDMRGLAGAAIYAIDESVRNRKS